MLCEYGCGQEAIYKFKNGKWCCSEYANSCLNVRKKYSRKKSVGEKAKISLKMKGDNNPSKRLEVRERQSEASRRRWEDVAVRHEIIQAMKETWSNQSIKEERLSAIKEGKNNQKVREKISQAAKKQCLNGHAAYMNSFIRNPSKEGTKFVEITLELFPEAEPEFKILNYSVDVAIEKYKIALEYDGWYHFNCQESIDYHNKRQKEIEALGWKFIRYNIFQKFPSKKQLKKDILEILNEKRVYEQRH